MPKRVPTPEGAVLHFFRLGKGKTELEMAEAAGVTPQTVRNWETGRTPLYPQRLEEVLSAIDVPPEAISEALLAHRLGTLPEEPGSFAIPTGKVGRLIHQAAAAAGTAAAETVRTRLIQDWRLRLAQDHRRWAEEQWTKIKKLTPEKQEMVLGVLLDERNWALAERLCHASETAATDKASEALRLAQLAVRLAEQLPESQRTHVLGYCMDFKANALRVGGDLVQAETTFLMADDLWSQSGGSLLASLLTADRRPDLKASLLIYIDRAGEALALLEQALGEDPSDKSRIRLLSKKARALEFAGEYERALEVIQQAEDCGAAEQNSRLYSVLLFNRAVNLCHLDRFEEADQRLPQVIAAMQESELDQIRLCWLRGRAWSGLGRRREAITALEQVRQGFRSREIDYDFALVSLELAVLYLEENRPRAAKALSEEMLWIFQRQKVRKEALAALRLFCEAAKIEKVQADWARQMVKYLYRAQYVPGLNFRH